ncbi:MAG: hypothetical protein ACYDHD_04395 [Vulcanimicrobiaceae bacterium]
MNFSVTIATAPCANGAARHCASSGWSGSERYRQTRFGVSVMAVVLLGADDPRPAQRLLQVSAQLHGVPPPDVQDQRGDEQERQCAQDAVEQHRSSERAAWSKEKNVERESPTTRTGNAATTAETIDVPLRGTRRDERSLACVRAAYLCARPARSHRARS